MAMNKVEICGVDTSTLPVISNERMRELFPLVHSGDLNAREEFIRGNLRLVLSVIQRFSNRGENVDDLFQVGCIGLIKALDNFDVTQNVRFSTYAVPLITGELKRFFRDDSMMKVSRGLKEQGYHIAKAREKIEQEKGRDATLEEISKETGLSTEEILMATEANREVSSLSQSIYEKDGSEISLEEQLSAKGGAVPAGSDQSGEGDYEKEFVVNRILVEQLLGELNEKERKLITLRYFEEKTQVQAAKELGVSQVQVSRLEKKILLRLRKRV